jgi:GH25 family lysozyme M1 (1,4-beta-N-acetylmuramidase)
MTRTLIVDISHHQPSNKIDWAKAAKEVFFFIIRVQYGSSTIDREFKSHVANCKKYGIPFGHYAYGRFISVADAKVEAKDFLDRIDKEAKFLVLDTEGDTINSCGTKNVAEASQAFIDVCKSAGLKTGFYVSHHLYKSHGLEKVNADFLWIPRYGVNDGTANKKPDFNCDLWQYTEKGKVSWYPSYLDLNILHGSKSLEWFIGNIKVAEALKTQVKSEVVKKPLVKGNSNIRTFQSWLNTNYKAGLVVDGIYGDLTMAAVIKALQIELNKQFNAGLAVDGKWGPKTKSTIRTVKKGAKGNITRIIQGMLYCLGYNPSGFDGVFGNGCESAVEVFQDDSSLSSDGIVGKNTFSEMF